MNETQMSAKWLQITGMIKQKWGMLTDNEVTQAEGNIDFLVGKIKERYSLTKESALHQVNEIFNSWQEKEKVSVPVQELP